MDNNVIQQRIFEVNGYKVMLDFDLAELYGVPTKALNQAVRRNLERFPPDFMFRLTKEQWDAQRSQFVTLSSSMTRICNKIQVENKNSAILAEIKKPPVETAGL